MYTLCLLGPDHAHGNARVDRLIELAKDAPPQGVRVVDRLGHERSAYRGLLVYSWLRAMGLSFESLPRDAFGRWDHAIRHWCDLLESRLTAHRLPDGPIAASDAPSAVDAAWSALALHAAGRLLNRAAWTDLAAETFSRLVRSRSRGGFLTPTRSDNPETLWFHELVLLQAIGSYAVQAEDRLAAAAVAGAGVFHLNETQPDHATTQPWGLFGLIWNEQARPLADAMIHTASVHQPGGLDGVSLMLVTDTVYCLRLFTRPTKP